jgi:hypothetical protein
MASTIACIVLWPIYLWAAHTGYATPPHKLLLWQGGWSDIWNNTWFWVITFGLSMALMNVSVPMTYMWGGTNLSPLTFGLFFTVGMKFCLVLYTHSK